MALERVERRDLREQAAPPADTVVANLTRPLLLAVAERMPARPAALIVSGLLDGEADEAAAAFEPLLEHRRLSSLGWSGLPDPALTLPPARAEALPCLHPVSDPARSACVGHASRM